MTRTHTPTPEAGTPANNMTRRQGGVIVILLLALVCGLGLFALRAESDRQAKESDARVACMTRNLTENIDADMRRGC